MNIFVVGYAQCFKSSFSKELASITGFNHIEASAVFRSKHPHLGHSKEDAIKLSIQAIEDLKNDPLVCVNSIKAKFKENNIIEGIRNPSDFILLFNPQKDKLVFLYREAEEKNDYSEFEIVGLAAIKKIMQFYKFLYNLRPVYLSMKEFSDVKTVAEQYKNDVGL